MRKSSAHVAGQSQLVRMNHVSGSEGGVYGSEAPDHPNSRMRTGSGRTFGSTDWGAAVKPMGPAFSIQHLSLRVAIRETRSTPITGDLRSHA